MQYIKNAIRRDIITMSMTEMMITEARSSDMNSDVINNTRKTDALSNTCETDGFPKEPRMRGILVVTGTLLISAIGFFGMKMPYASPTDTLLTLALGGCDGPGAPQFLCSYHMNTLFSLFLYLIRRMTGAFNVYGFALIALLTLASAFLVSCSGETKPDEETTGRPPVTDAPVTAAP